MIVCDLDVAEAHAAPCPMAKLKSAKDGVDGHPLFFPSPFVVVSLVSPEIATLHQLINDEI